MGEAKRRSEQRGASLRRRFGGAPLDLCIFPLSAIKPPRSPADLPLAMWRLKIGLETLERQGRGELFCVVCDEPIASAPPPLVGFVRADDPKSELCGFSVCETCFRVAEGPEEVTDMVSEALGGVAASLRTN
jgi:hypothetical protein